FLVRIDIDLSDVTEPRRRRAARRRAAAGRELLASGALRRIWRVPGRLANVSLYEAPDASRAPCAPHVAAAVAMDGRARGRTRYASARGALTPSGRTGSARDGGRETCRKTPARRELDRLAGLEGAFEIVPARPRLDAERVRPRQRRCVCAAVRLPDGHPGELARLPLAPERQSQPG